MHLSIDIQNVVNNLVKSNFAEMVDKKREPPKYFTESFFIRIFAATIVVCFVFCSIRTIRKQHQRRIGGIFENKQKMRKIIYALFVSALLLVMMTGCGNGNRERNDTITETAVEEINPLVSLCLEDTSRNPIAILERLMSQPECRMHGPEHHVLVGAALLTAYNNCLPDSAKLDMKSALAEVVERGQQVPGGACGYMGACGASISTGIFMSVITRNTPFSTDTWRLCNLVTSRALEQVAENGGPRCCKRDSYLSVLAAIDFVKDNLGVEMEKPAVRCSRSQINEQCIGKKCPFSPMQ